MVFQVGNQGREVTLVSEDHRVSLPLCQTESGGVRDGPTSSTVGQSLVLLNVDHRDRFEGPVSITGIGRDL